MCSVIDFCENRYSLSPKGEVNILVFQKSITLTFTETEDSDCFILLSDYNIEYSPQFLETSLLYTIYQCVFQNFNKFPKILKQILKISYLTIFKKFENSKIFFFLKVKNFKNFNKFQNFKKIINFHKI